MEDNISSEELYNNIFQNKIYLEIPDNEFVQKKYDKLEHIKLNNKINDIFNKIKLTNYINNDNLKLIINYDNDFNDISIKKKQIDDKLIEKIKNDNNIDKFENIIKNNDKFIKKNNNIDKFENIIKNSDKFIKKNNRDFLDKKYQGNFITELCELMFIDLNTFKTQIINYINNKENIDYLISLTKFYKKFRTEISTILVKKNINEDITNNYNFLKLISKIFDINIIIFKNGLYKLYTSQKNPKEFNLFNKYKLEFDKDDKQIIKYYYKYCNLLNLNEWLEFKNFNIYNFYKNSITKINKESNIKLIIKEYKCVNSIIKMKVDKLKDLSSINNLTTNHKKIDLQNNLLYIYNEFN
jgi:hypothetical protein